MKLSKLFNPKGALIAATALALMSSSAMAEDLNLWVRSSGANAAQVLADLWNSSHADQIALTVIPDNQMVTKLATSVQAGDVPDMVSFDLIFMPDFMRAGFLTDLTDQLAADENQAKVAPAFKNLATYEGRMYGTGFTPDVSILVYNKDLFRAAGLDPESPPTTLAQIHEYATKIAALGDDTYGYYFSGSCGGCNIFTVAPMMWGSGTHLLPANGEDAAIEGPGAREVLQLFHDMWSEGLIPESAEGDTGSNFQATFETGKVGMQGSGGFAIAALKANHPEMDFGISFLPGINPENASSFVGGDVIAIPTGSKHAEAALEFIKWQLTDEAQLEGLAKNYILPSRTDLADNKYFAEETRYITTAKAIGIGQTPWVFHFNDMVNSDSSPWLQMLQVAIFDGDIDGAIEEARAAMKQIASE